MIQSNQPTLSELTAELAEAKSREAAARDHRIEIEQAILLHPDLPPLKAEGTTTHERLRIVTGFTRRWDQQQLAELQLEVDDPYFPFRVELREDRAASKLTERNFPDLWAKIRGALELRPKKTAITVLDKED